LWLLYNSYLKYTRCVAGVAKTYGNRLYQLLSAYSTVSPLERVNPSETLAEGPLEPVNPMLPFTSVLLLLVTVNAVAESDSGYITRCSLASWFK